MSGIELEQLLEPISGTAPSGEDLEYDPLFQKMRREVSGQPEREMGESVIPAVEPDWKRAVSLSLDLLSRTKDLRVAITLSESLLHLEGLSGLAKGTGFALRLLEDFWDSLHPRLDPDDNNDPTARVNALLDLCGRATFIDPLREIPLVRSRVFGAVTLRDLEIASGKLTAASDSKTAPLDLQTVDAAFQDCEIDDLRDTATAARNALDNIRKTEALVTNLVGAAQAPDLSPITDLLAEAASVLGKQLATRAGKTGNDQAPTAGAEAPEGTTAAASSEPTASSRMSAGITSREDVIRMLDKICDYYAHNEPSSPIPLLLQRARRLVTKDFMDIVRDLAPDAVAQVESIRGSEEKK